MKNALIAMLVVVSFPATTCWALDAKGCAEVVVGRAKALSSVGAGREDMARAICHDLTPADRDTFATCTQNATTKQALSACINTAGKKAMGR